MAGKEGSEGEEKKESFGGGQSVAVPRGEVLERSGLWVLELGLMRGVDLGRGHGGNEAIAGSREGENLIISIHNNHFLKNEDEIPEAKPRVPEDEQKDDDD
uniref:Uncharacterized protein n=1 Tax=Brassica campestris TaxID=3711 RepID=M4CVL1_BRACM